jgi:hypothetical protein
MTPRCIVYDIEIVKAIPDKKVPPVAGVQYCEGWRDFAGMGIAVLCAIDADEQVARVFLEDNLSAFAEWSKDAILCGHSNHQFDDQILKALGLWTAAGSYDILRHLRAAVGEPMDFTPGRTKGGRKVDDIARLNLNGMQKSLDGGQAPVLWQQGRRGQVIDYCCRDVAIEYALFLRREALVDPVTRAVVKLADPRV